MATIIRVADPSHGPQAVAFNFDDLTAQAAEHVTQANARAARIVAEAQQRADAIRQQAAEEGRQTAVRAAKHTVAEQLAPVLSALRQAAADLQSAKQTWFARWESSAVRLASAMAARIVRGELRRQPEIPLTLVREALELAAGSPNVQVHLHPQDYKKLGAQVRALTEAMSGLGEAEVTADATIEHGGCRVETRFGTIDQQFESQLKRMEEELTG
jgi:flagellar biosynthesis/type III secretory pathway protein FliH